MDPKIDNPVKAVGHFFGIGDLHSAGFFQVNGPYAIQYVVCRNNARFSFLGGLRSKDCFPDFQNNLSHAKKNFNI